jgi:rSAM/selenodomain-associated transferase 2
MLATPPFLSIILPVLNEATLIRSFLLHLRTVAPAAEIIVVDGGSSDGTVSIAKPLADVLVAAPRGRASQMNAGAACARGEALWFLHADLQLPRNAAARIERVLADRRVAGGCFRLRFPPRPLIYRVSDSLGNAGVEVFGFALGDHGIFCRRAEFERLGGYPEVPILEDAEIYRALRRRGRMVQLRDEIASSPRAFQKYGPYRTTAVYFLILVLYVAGFPIGPLNRIHRWFRGSAIDLAAASELAHASR